MLTKQMSELKEAFVPSVRIWVGIFGEISQQNIGVEQALVSAF